MQGDRLALQALNKNLGLLLVSINQYFLHARILRNWGFAELGEALYKHSIRDMKSADALIERILLLEGLPNLQEYGKILVGENIIEILQCDQQVEQAKHVALADAIAVCESQLDFVSRDLLEQQKAVNEEYLDWLGTQLDLIEEVGLANYAQTAAQAD
ncbi:bacterioferritin [Snodgrassella alvi]|uniref:bacterioferritin n=1 Tax=Snodgrassella alvi TaxID=1196083 RepID=UPI000D7889AA|nr:bacterioferritin [Snodgrassella alvi]PXY95758.1 bacterioferritin [Snodgrassella alvi]